MFNFSQSVVGEGNFLDSNDTNAALFTALQYCVVVDFGIYVKVYYGA